MSSHNEFEGIAAEFCSSNGREEWIAVGACPFPEPSLQNLERLRSQWCAALFAPLALAANMGSCAGHDIATAKVNEFRCS